VFSRRLPPDLRPTPLARLRAARPRPPFDLTVSNPTRCGLPYPGGLLAALADPAGLVYSPDPRGLESARRAVAADYRRHGVEVDPERIVLTASSSEAYAILFKLLCDPGDAVLVPTPSYPLFEHLAALEGIRAAPYPLDPGAGWQPAPDPAGPERARALIVVHPNNPTGSYVTPAAAARLVDTAARCGLALIVDEVFLDYPLRPAARPASFAATEPVLTFALGGLSKGLGLPQLKLGWIVASGPPGAVDEALDRLAFIADHYLSVGTPVQLALPRLMADAAPVRLAIRERCRRNLDALDELARELPAVSVLRPDGGWSAGLRYPAALVDEEALALALLEEDGVAVHPGYFFDFPTAGYVVVSLLPEPETFAAGVARLLQRVATRL
jgi:aspartate/methionine/tyrosine aminotransferase